jgi:hypothetical protein
VKILQTVDLLAAWGSENNDMYLDMFASKSRCAMCDSVIGSVNSRPLRDEFNSKAGRLAHAAHA